MMKVITTTYQNNQKQTTVTEMEGVTGQAVMEAVILYPNIKYQRILGFGGAVTDATGYVYTKLSKDNQEKVIDLYYGDEGLGYTLARSHIDSCDFSVDVYTAMEDEHDREMASFDLARSEQYILPFMKDAQDKLRASLDLMLSPWSPPAFMKDNQNRLHGGKLKEEYRQFWADYICRYIKEYQKRGFTVERITVQNEPEATQTWDSCLYTAQEEKTFIRDYLYKTLRSNGLSNVKINIWDHNKERLVSRVSETIDQDTRNMIDGIAFHWYTGDHFEAVGIIHQLYPEKELIFTEGCVEYSRFNDDQLKNAQMYAHDIIGNLNQGMTGFIDWNMLLDQTGGPNHVKNYCDAPIMIDTKENKFEVKLSYEYIGHFSCHIKKGARRIGFTKYTDKIELTAFQNEDNSIVAVALNRSSEDIPFTIEIEGEVLQLQIPRESIMTIKK